MRDLDLSTVEIKKGILIEPVEESEFEYYFDLAIQSESMEGIERELESYGIEIDPATDCPTDIYILTDFRRRTVGVRTDFTVQTKSKPGGKLAGWWKEDKERPILDVRMYFPDGDDKPTGNAYLRAGNNVILEYELSLDGTPIQNVFASGGKEGYPDRSELDDFFDLLPK